MSGRRKTRLLLATFATIHGLKNGSAYQIFVAAINDFGPGDPAISAPVTPSAH